MQQHQKEPQDQVEMYLQEGFQTIQTKLPQDHFPEKSPSKMSVIAIVAQSPSAPVKRNKEELR
jgi:hypothetical protein